MAAIWYDSIPCCCDDLDCRHQSSALAQLERDAVVVTMRDERGRWCRIPLSPGWARLLAARLQQAADQTQQRPVARTQVRPKGFQSRGQASRSTKT